MLGQSFPSIQASDSPLGKPVDNLDLFCIYWNNIDLQNPFDSERN